MLNIARVLPVTGTIMGVYDLYQGVKEKNAKKSITAAACLGFGAFAGIGKGIKFLNKAGKISDKAAGLLQATGNAVATAYQAELFCESLSNAGEELSTNGKISIGTLADMAITGLSTYLFGKATIKSIPRRAPEKLKTGAAGTGKTKTTAAKELAGEMPAVSGKVDGGSGVVRRKGGLELDLQFFAKERGSSTAKLRDTKNIRYSQDNIRGTFDDGTNVNELVYHLKNSPEYASTIEPIRLVKYNDLPREVQQYLGKQGVSSSSVFTLDNRRLYAAKQAGVKVNSVLATQADLEGIDLIRRFTTETAGKTIEIR